MTWVSALDSRTEFAGWPVERRKERLGHWGAAEQKGSRAEHAWGSWSDGGGGASLSAPLLCVRGSLTPQQCAAGRCWHRPHAAGRKLRVGEG